LVFVIPQKVGAKLERERERDRNEDVQARCVTWWDYVVISDGRS
jgi:hypothetical protein